MASLGMQGSYTFSSAKIDEVITRTSAGNYALGYTKDDGTFVVQYVGRSDTDLNAELKAKLNSKYKKFKYAYATSPKAAFEKECRNYHDFGESESLHNEYHPDRPDGTTWECPVCDRLD
ncbi:hypothetical protein ES703_102485 [subsurface metagenome]